MEANKTSLERAFELARSGKYQTMTEISRELQSEGYSIITFDGPSLKKQLKDLMLKSTVRSS